MDLNDRNQTVGELNASVQNTSGDAERKLTELSANISSTLKQNAEDVERTLLGVSSEVARTFIGKADEIAAAVSARAVQPTWPNLGWRCLRKQSTVQAPQHPSGLPTSSGYLR
jgi:hypothetical protein